MPSALLSQRIWSGKVPECKSAEGILRAYGNHKTLTKHLSEKTLCQLPFKKNQENTDPCDQLYHWWVVAAESGHLWSTLTK